MDLFVMAVWGIIFLVLIVKFFQSIRLVSTQTAHIVERFGKYHKTLEAGFHALVPFIDTVTFMQDLREEAIDVPPQDCFTRDEVKVIVDGVIYMSVMDPVKASYGIVDYRDAAVLLAQTTTRSVIGTLDLDRTFEERNVISAKVVEVLDKAGASWGIRVHRYEIKNISPPHTVRNAMEMQVNAEREGRAIIATAEGDKQSRINRSEGLKAELINRSEGEMQKVINEAGGTAAFKFKLSERYIDVIASLENSRIILPANIGEYNGWLDNLSLDTVLKEKVLKEKPPQRPKA